MNVPPPTEGRRPHGALRDQVLHLLLHAARPLTARQVTEALTTSDGTTPALTTILTVLDRLHRAGEVTKSRDPGAELQFTVARQDAELVADDMLESLLRSSDRTGALLSFAGALDPEDLDALQALVERRTDRGTEPDARGRRGRAGTTGQ